MTSFQATLANVSETCMHDTPEYVYLNTGGTCASMLTPAPDLLGAAAPSPQKAYANE